MNSLTFANADVRRDLKCYSRRCVCALFFLLFISICSSSKVWLYLSVPSSALIFSYLFVVWLFIPWLPVLNAAKCKMQQGIIHRVSQQ